MRKIIKEWGKCAVILLSKEDMKAYGLEKGMIVDFFIADKWKADEEPKPEPTNSETIKPNS